jgi:NADH-quinone oxidoreductase subunit E
MSERAMVDLTVVHKIAEKNAGKPGALITILQEVQEAIGYLPEEVIEEVSRLTNIPASKIYGVATFYSQFRLEPAGKHTVKICQGTACHVAGASRVVEDCCKHLNVEPGNTTEDGLFTIEPVACLGCCSLATAVMIDDSTYGRVDSKRMIELLDEVRGGE